MLSTFAMTSPKSAISAVGYGAESSSAAFLLTGELERVGVAETPPAAAPPSPVAAGAQLAMGEALQAWHRNGRPGPDEAQLTLELAA